MSIKYSRYFDILRKDNRFEHPLFKSLRKYISKTYCGVKANVSIAENTRSSARLKSTKNSIEIKGSSKDRKKPHVSFTDEQDLENDVEKPSLNESDEDSQNQEPPIDGPLQRDLQIKEGSRARLDFENMPPDEDSPVPTSPPTNSRNSCNYRKFA